jgi:hypothetical protein
MIIENRGQGTIFFNIRRILNNKGQKKYQSGFWLGAGMTKGGGKT